MVYYRNAGADRPVTVPGVEVMMGDITKIRLKRANQSIPWFNVEDAMRGGVLYFRMNEIHKRIFDYWDKHRKNPDMIIVNPKELNIAPGKVPYFDGIPVFTSDKVEFDKFVVW
jgi:uncharacterized cupredoxin-like copper-binding protein